MPSYLRGSRGREVTRIQARLTELGFYRGPADGDFGGGTELAVRQFQTANTLRTDGRVGEETWRRLFPGELQVPAPAILQEPVAFRCLALTGAFETSAPPPECFCYLAGDYDGQGLSFGALQFNFGQQTLQPILRELDRRYPDLMAEIFGDRLAVLRAALGASPSEQLAFARSLQDPRFRLDEPWRGMFKTLGRHEACHALQVQAAGGYFERAKTLCATHGVQTARALALMFDIAVQNGGIDQVTRALIERDVARLPPSGDAAENEVARLRIIASRRAEGTAPRWIEDVRARKLCIANGEGRVHGSYYHLEEQYGIGLEPFS